jgi:hypothetical protein
MQSSASTAHTRRSVRGVHQPGALAVVHDVAPLAVAVNMDALIDEVSKLPMIMGPECKDVRVFAATTTQSLYNNGRRYFKCPRKNYVSAVVEYDYPKFQSCTIFHYCLWL